MGGKSGMIKHLWRWYLLYCAVGFVILIPRVWYFVAQHGLPKVILLFVIPAYALMAVSFYHMFKNLKPK